DYTSRTALYSLPDENVSLNGVIENLYIQFQSDPLLTLEDLVNLFKNLREKGTKKVVKVIIVKPSLKIPEISSNWMFGDVQSCFAAPVSELTVNRNLELLKVEPSKNQGESAKVTAIFNVLPVKNQTVTSNCPNADVNVQLTGNVVTLTGCVDLSAKKQHICLPVKDVNYFIAKAVSDALTEAGIAHSKEIAFDVLPENSLPVVSHNSEPLLYTIRTALKKSDNYVFDTLFLKLASLNGDSFTTWRQAGSVIKEIISKNYGIDLTDSVIVGGSGLSRYNLITPAQMTDILVSAYHNFENFAEFISALPVANYDGTLKNRMPDLKGQVRAKTGVLTGVTTLAGYLKTEEGEIFAVSIFINGHIDPSEKYRKIQDDICLLCR
ncbi:MAG TPA: D-alanyl-D-alanine carboxypeptidase/D-alanyl-D-alanine-endopeptidase, partial [Elusimicrobiales bacterium]|nr:D-alanyl-D-alanine carboxypeptidase/D-alanyl-D-alanine-endopeptidase [Elusimicrobiales bacterium]